MRNLLFNFICIFTICISIISCEKENNILSSEDDFLQSRSINDDLDEKLFEVGRLISNNLHNQNLSAILKNTYEEQCIEEFLVATLLENIILESEDYQKLNELVHSNPLITIAFPSFAFKTNKSFEAHLSDIEFTVILVEDPDQVSTLPAYNANGELISISSTFNEQVNYCVIKYSEEIIAVNSVTNESIFGEEMPIALSQISPQNVIGDYNIYLGYEKEIAELIDRGLIENEDDISCFEYLTLCDGIDDDDYLDPRGGGGCDELCDRDCPPKTKDELHRIKWSSKKAVKVYESGFHLPKLELFAHYVIPVFVSPTKADVNVVSKYIVGHWKNMTGDYSNPLNLEIQSWLLENNMGQNWYVTWFERDYWHTTSEKFSIGFSTGGTFQGVEAKATIGYDLTIKKKDKCIGSSTIEYCDPALGEGQEYHTYNYLNDGPEGGFWFREHVRNQ